MENNMAYTIQPDDLLKIRLYTSLRNQAAVNTFYYHVLPAAMTGTWDAALVLTNWANVMAPLLKPVLAILAHYDGCSIQSIKGSPFTALIYSSQASGNGTNATNPLPTAVCGMISRRSSFAGPRWRGRLYMPFPTSSSIDTNGQPSATYITGLTNFANGVEPPAGMTMTGSGTSLRLDPVIYSKVAKTWAAIIGHEYPSKFGTQHKRGDYGKPNFSPAMLNPV